MEQVFAPNLCRTSAKPYKFPFIPLQISFNYDLYKHNSRESRRVQQASVSPFSCLVWKKLGYKRENASKCVKYSAILYLSLLPKAKFSKKEGEVSPVPWELSPGQRLIWPCAPSIENSWIRHCIILNIKVYERVIL